MAKLASIRSLQYLILNGAAITDASLPALAELPELESLYVEQTDVTEAGLAKLLKAKPGLHLHW